MKLFNVTWATDTAGPSPYLNMRTEIFLKGCKRAIDGSPCVGCFNFKLWNEEAEIQHKPEDIAEQINKFAPNKYVTIGGGEPLDQLPELIILTKKLKEYGFNIMVYSWRQLKELLKDNYEEVIPSYHKDGYKISEDIKLLLQNVDIFIDGQFIKEQCLYDANKKDGLFSSVGSANQIFWDIKSKTGFKMSDIIKINMSQDSDLTFINRINSKKIELEEE